MVLAAIVSAALAFVVCLAAAPLGRALGVVDVPDGRRKRHPHATPLTGGLAVALPLALVVTFLAARTAYTPFYLTVAVALVLLVAGVTKEITRNVRGVEATQLQRQ